MARARSFGDGSACPLQTAGLGLANSSFQSEAGLGGDKAESVSSPGPAALLSLMSASRTKRTSRPAMSAFESKADIAFD